MPQNLKIYAEKSIRQRSQYKKIAFLVICFVLLAGSIICFKSVNAEDVLDAPETEEVQDLKSRIDQKKNEIDGLTTQIEKYKEMIKTKEAQANTLESQISILENQIAKKELDVKKIQAEIDEKKLEIEESIELIQKTENQILLQKERIADSIRAINMHDERTTLELLLSHNKFSEFFDALTYLETLGSEIKGIYDNLLSLKLTIETQKEELEEKKSLLEEDKKKLDDEQEKLENQQYSKEIILEQTVQTEHEFRNLIYQIQQEQAQSAQQIRKLEEEVKDKLDAERLKRQQQGRQIDDPTKLSWPLPNQGITASFHDPDYPFRKWIGEHSGIDIRTLRNGTPTNGLPVKSAADGIVLKIIREGKLAGNIVYIMHDNGIMTVYMHLSRIDLKEDQYISRGEVIGLSGGMPGTAGAGRLSTGPHLHFEVRLNGIPVNPLSYLP
ncbi:murein hydrolase activator EnvC family protein [Patescibacteria group bacterium]